MERASLPSDDGREDRTARNGSGADGRSRGGWEERCAAGEGERPDRRRSVRHHDPGRECEILIRLGKSEPHQGAGNAGAQTRTVPGVGLRGGLRTLGPPGDGFGLRRAKMVRVVLVALVTLAARSHGMTRLLVAVGRSRRAREVVDAVGIVEPRSSQDELHP